MTDNDWLTELIKHPGTVIQLRSPDGSITNLGGLLWYKMHNYIPELPSDKAYVNFTREERHIWVTETLKTIEGQTIKPCQNGDRLWA